MAVLQLLLLLLLLLQGVPHLLFAGLAGMYGSSRVARVVGTANSAMKHTHMRLAVCIVENICLRLLMRNRSPSTLFMNKTSILQMILQSVAAPSARFQPLRLYTEPVR
jgi:hypothetical protein